MELSSSVNYRLSSGKLFQAYIISGPAGSGKMRLAKEIAKQAVCTGEKTGNACCGKCSDCRKADLGLHPDIITVEKAQDKKEYQVDAIRQVRSDAYVIPNEAQRKVYIITEADRLSVPCQNTLLKTLEEPPKHAVFILVAENSGTLLDTVRSRCVELSLTPEKSTAAVNENASREAEELMGAIVSGSKLALTEKLVSMEGLSKTDFADMAAEMRKRAVLAVKGEGSGAALSRNELVKIAEIFSTVLKNLEFNVSTGHIVGFLMSELL